MENTKLGRQTFQPGQPPVIIGFMRGKKYDNVGALSLEKGGEWWYNTPRNL